MFLPMVILTGDMVMFLLKSSEYRDEVLFYEKSMCH